MIGFLKGVFSRRAVSLEDLGLSERKIRQIACHEAGHVLVTHLCGAGETLVSASIIPSETGYGEVRMKADPHFMMASTRSELENAIAVKMGGRAAEEIVFGREEISTGCQHDLATATMLATKMVALWGFSERLGLVSIDIKMSADMPEVRTEAASILERQYARALDAIGKNRDALDELAGRLVRDRFLVSDDIRRLLEETGVR